MGLTVSFIPLEILSLTELTIANPILVPIHCNKCETDVNLRIDYSPKVNILTSVEDFIFSDERVGLVIC